MRAFITSRPRTATERSVNGAAAPVYQHWYGGYLKLLRGGSNPEFECIDCEKAFFGVTRGTTHLYCCDGSGIEKCPNISDERKEIVKARYETQSKKRKAEAVPDAQPSAAEAKAKRYLPKGWKEVADKMFARLIFLALLPFCFGEEDLEEEEAEKVAAFDQSDSEYASDCDSELEAGVESSDDEGL